MTSPSNNNRKKQPSKSDRDRRICFDSNPDILKIDSRLDYSSHERLSTWYTAGERRCFKDEYDRAIIGNSTETIDFERAKRIDAVRDLLLKAQDVQRTMRHNASTKSSNAKLGSYSRWLADFYKLQSEECGIAARHRGMENFSMANERWYPQHHELDQDIESSDSDSEVDTGVIRRPLPFKKRLVKTNRWSDDDDSGSDEAHPLPRRRFKQERWSAGPSDNASKDAPLKPLKHNLTPPRLHRYNAEVAA